MLCYVDPRAFYVTTGWNLVGWYDIGFLATSCQSHNPTFAYGAAVERRSVRTHAIKHAATHEEAGTSHALYKVLRVALGVGLRLP